MTSYDAWNRLVAVYTDDSGSPDDILTQYEYDGQNRLVLRGADTDADGSLDAFTHYFHNDEQVVETRDSSSPAPSPESLDPTYQYVWSARYIDSPILRDANTDADGLCDDGRIYYLTDANANVTALIDTSGMVIERYVYTPYGDVTIYDSTWTNTRGTSSYDNTILYTGRELDAETGLYNYRARWYHTGLGVMTTRDPLGFSAGDANLYRYVGGNPISRTDPSGMLVEEPTIYYGSGYTECPFGAFDGRAPAGYDVQIPGGSEVHVPQYGILVLNPWICPTCGDMEFSGGLFYPGSSPPWTLITFNHFHMNPGYSPSPGYSDSWWECLTQPSKMGKTAEYIQYGAYGMIAVGVTGLTIIYAPVVAGKAVRLLNKPLWMETTMAGEILGPGSTMMDVLVTPPGLIVGGVLWSAEKFMASGAYLQLPQIGAAISDFFNPAWGTSRAGVAGKLVDALIEEERNK